MTRDSPRSKGFIQPLRSHELCKPLWKMYTLPETNIAPENGWLEYYFPIGFWQLFRGYVSFREGNTLTSFVHQYGTVRTEQSCLLKAFNRNCMLLTHIKSSWWFQPIWKILVKLDHFPNFRGENSKNIWVATTMKSISSNHSAEANFPWESWFQTRPVMT